MCGWLSVFLYSGLLKETPPNTAYNYDHEATSKYFYLSRQTTYLNENKYFVRRLLNFLDLKAYVDILP